MRARHGDVGVCALRYAPVVGSHVPSPLGRLLRLPAVPGAAFADPPFSLLHPDDAADAMVAAIERRYDGPLNVVGPGAATPWQAVRLGGRVPLPVLAAVLGRGRARRRARGRRDRAARRRAAAPRPHRFDGGRAVERARPHATCGPTQDVLRELFEWAERRPDPDRAGRQCA